VEVVEHRQDEPSAAILHELLHDADNAMQVDCADARSPVTVVGYFVFPKGSLMKPDPGTPA
jgi:hypothetical protein